MLFLCPQFTLCLQFKCISLVYNYFSSTAQFWNIPINIDRPDPDNVFVEIFSPENPSYRRIPAFEAPRTWDHKHATCYYVGNSQGGPSQSHNPVESVIEGRLSNYETRSLFAPEFLFRRFGETCDEEIAS